MASVFIDTIDGKLRDHWVIIYRNWESTHPWFHLTLYNIPYLPKFSYYSPNHLKLTVRQLLCSNYAHMHEIHRFIVMGSGRDISYLRNCDHCRCIYSPILFFPSCTIGMETMKIQIGYYIGILSHLKILGKIGVREGTFI